MMAKGAKSGMEISDMAPSDRMEGHTEPIKKLRLGFFRTNLNYRKLYEISLLL